MQGIQKTVSPLTGYQIASVLRRAFSYMDPRLVHHGERVAFIAYETTLASARPGNLNRNTLALLAALHDVGAYKTEEIDRMVHFETEDVSAHSVFGYLFLQSTTSLNHYAEAILYHHTPWSALREIDTPVRDYAALIHLADRVDILLAGSREHDLSALRRLSGDMFQPELVALFEAADRERHICDKIHSGEYQIMMDDWLRTFRFPTSSALELLKMIVYAIDFRSPFTVTHTANTTAISGELGRILGLSPRDQATLETGAFLHDIGKIAIPVEILESPGRLAPEEMEKMRSHVTVSGEIIRGLVSDEICEIAVRHHEKCNGTGYPRGLGGAELTLPQRIVAVADIVSALIGRRSYKTAFPKEEVIGILTAMRERGELCPKVCGAMLAHYDEIIHAAAQESDPVLRRYKDIQRSYPELSRKVQALEG